MRKIGDKVILKEKINPSIQLLKYTIYDIKGDLYKLGSSPNSGFIWLSEKYFI